MKKIITVFLLMLVNFISKSQCHYMVYTGGVFISSVSQGCGDTLMAETSSDGLFLAAVKDKSVRPGCASCLSVKMPEGYLWGYMDSSKNVVIPFEYDFAKPFTDGAAVVGKCDSMNRMNGYNKWHINTGGKKIYPGKFVDVWNYNGKYAIVDVDGAYHMCHIDRSGRRAYQQTYKYLTPFSDSGYAIGLKKIDHNTGKALWVVINTSGAELHTQWAPYWDDRGGVPPEDMMKWL